MSDDDRDCRGGIFAASFIGLLVDLFLVAALAALAGLVWRAFQ